MTLHAAALVFLLSPAGLGMLRDGILGAGLRDKDMQELPWSMGISEGGVDLPISVECAPRLPDKDGNGCRIAFPSLTKDVSLKTIEAKVTEVEKKLASTAPASETLGFGNPFAGSGDDAGYSCRPESKAWACYLDVRPK